MKKYSYLIALMTLAGAMALSPLTAKAQDDKQAELERNFYDACYTKKDKATCLPLAKDLLDKYPNSQYKKYADQQIKNDLSDRFQSALNGFHGAPDGGKLELLVKAAEDYMVKETGPTAVAYVVTRVALAATYGSMGNMYKDTAKAKSYAERALQLMANEKAPEGWDQKDYAPLRETAMAQLNQFLGFNILQANGDSKQAVDYLNKAIAVKHKDGLGWKDPNNYWLRSNVTFQDYQKLSKEYQGLSDEEKTGDKGKGLLVQINPTIDRLIADYARVVVCANKPETKSLKDDAQKQLDSFWKYRTDKPEALAEYLKKFEADPTIPDPPVPAKAETSEVSADAPPAGGVGAPKLTTAVSATPATGAAGGAKAAGSTTTKSKAKPRKRGRG